MTPPQDTTSTSSRRRRADAERSVARILEAALEALESDPDASMGEIARRAGVVRATVYVHFPDREALLAAVTERVISDVVEVIRGAEPEKGAPDEALARVVAATWRSLGRFHALIAVNTRLAAPELHRLHVPVLELLHPLIARGQDSGTFRPDVPAAWHLSMLLAIVHAASGELRAGRAADADIEAAVVDTVLGAVRAQR